MKRQAEATSEEFKHANSKVYLSAFLTDVPDVIFYEILTYATRPTSRGPFMSSVLSLVSKSVRFSIEHNRQGVWESILLEYSFSRNELPKDGTSIKQNKRVLEEASSELRRQRRQSKRLRQTTAKQDVMAAHKVLCDRTEDAILQIAEMAHSASTSLTLARLRRLIRTCGPILNINQRAKMGGTMLVECCRARYVTETVVRKCVQELVVNHGADPNIPAAEGHAGFQGAALPPLVIAAARGMPTVVQALLDFGANPVAQGTSRFRLHTNPKKSVRGDSLNPLEFAYKVKHAEEQNGATKEQLRSILKVIGILEKQKANPKIEKSF